MSMQFSADSADRLRRACQQIGLFGNLSLTRAKRFELITYEINDNYELVEYKTIRFSVDAFENRGKKVLGSGNFHKAFKGEDEDGNIWVIKKPKRAEEIKHIPTDMLKQHLAFKLAEFFSDEVCKKAFKNVFLRYMRPLLASAHMIFNDGSKKTLDLFFEVESFIPGEFTYFNRPRGPTKELLNAGPLAPMRLPQVFSRWTYDVTSGIAMIADVQGCKLARGQYWCTDPIAFLNFDFSVGLVDWHSTGMKNFKAEYAKLLKDNPNLEELDSKPCFTPNSSQKKKMTALVKALAKLADKRQPTNIARMVQRKVRNKRSRSF